MVKKTVIYCIISLILSVCAAFLIQRHNVEMKPGFCADVCAHGDWIYSIDYDAMNKKVCVYRVDKYGKNLSRIPLDAQSLNSFYHYDDLYYDTADDEVYFYAGEYKTSSGILIGEKICCCDFDRHKFEIVWEVPVANKAQKNRSILAYHINGDTLEYLTNSEDEYAVNTISVDGESGFVRRVGCSDQTELTLYHFDSQGKVSAFSYAAGMYYESGDGLLEPVSGEKDVWASYCDPIWYNDDSLVWTDMRSFKIQTYNIAEHKYSTLPFPQTYSVSVDNGSKSYDISYNMLTTLGEADDGYAAYIELPVKANVKKEKNKFRFGVGICRNDKIDLLSVLYASKDDAVKMIVKTTLLFFGIALLFGLILLAGYRTVKRTGFISVRMEMVVFGVLLFALSFLIVWGVLSNAMKKMYIKNYNVMRNALQKSICSELDSMIELDPEFNDSTPYTKEFYDKLGRILPSENEFHDKSEERRYSEEAIRNPFTMHETFVPYFLFHIVNPNEELEILYNEGEIEHVPTDRLYYNSYLYSSNAEFAKVLEDKGTKEFRQYDTYGTWNVQIFYYENAEHGIRGVIEIGVNDYMIERKMMQVVFRALMIAAIAFLVMAAVILLYMSSVLAPIKKLGIQIQKGSIDLPRNKRLSMEIRRVWELIYVLINRGVKQQEELEKNNRENYRFFSQELFELFGKNELLEINTNSRRKCYLQIVHTVFEQPDPDKMPELTAELTEMCRKKGGILLAMDIYHAIWVFKDRRGEYLDAAKDVLFLAEKHNTVCGVGIGNGLCTLYIRGAEWNAEAAIAGEEAENTALIAEYAAKCGGMCLMTTSAAACAENVKTCEHRVGEDILCFEYMFVEQHTEREKADQRLISTVS